MAWDGAGAGATRMVVAGAGAAAIRMAMGIMVVGGGAGTAATSPTVGIETEHDSRRASGTCRLTFVSSLQTDRSLLSRCRSERSSPKIQWTGGQDS